MNIVRKYNLTEEEKKALDTVYGILTYIRGEEFDHFNNSILMHCEIDDFYYDYEEICNELTKEEN